ncbi:MAG: methytransferase partner Trm112 [Dehalococcoidia bacterium]
MRRDLMDILACPLDKAELRLEATSEQDGDVIAGSLVCASCGEVYPIADGIPNLLPPDLRAAMAEAASEPTGH